MCMYLYMSVYICVYMCVFVAICIYVCRYLCTYMYMGIRSQPQVCSLILLYHAFGDRVSASGAHRQVCTTAFGPSMGVRDPPAYVALYC